MSKTKSIVGEKRKMKNGLFATCVAYTNWADIDIQFEDGTVVRHRAKKAFYSGEIKHPNINAQIIKSSCVGEKRLMANGQYATCIKYFDCKNITLKFEDGTIVKNKSKRSFYLGSIGNPTIGTRITTHRSIVGQNKLMNCGMSATVINDRSAKSVDVQFEDGTIVKNRSRADFIRREIAHPFFTLRSFPQQFIFYLVKQYFTDAIADYRSSITKNSNTGHNLEIDIWIPSIKVAIEYDGYPWHAKETKTSKEKYISFVENPNIKQIYTFIEDGCIIHNSKKHLNIHIHRPNSNRSREENSFYSELFNKAKMVLRDLGADVSNLIYTKELFDKVRKSFNLGKHIGEEKMMKNGMKAKIIFYRSVNDIDVQFEDGTIVKNRRYNAFKTREIKNPSLPTQRDKSKSEFLGKELVMKNGMRAKIIEYRNTKDIDVQFEDGTVVKNKAVSNFINGRIGNPKIDSRQTLRKSIVGVKRKMNCGLIAECIAYRSAADIDVLFENGKIVQHKTKVNFMRGSIKG